MTGFIFAETDQWEPSGTSSWLPTELIFADSSVVNEPGQVDCENADCIMEIWQGDVRRKKVRGSRYLGNPSDDLVHAGQPLGYGR